MTESEMNALRELFTEMGAKLADDVEARLTPQYFGIQKTLFGVAAQMGQVLDRLTVIEGDISAMRAQLAGLTRLDAQRRLDSLEARFAALEAKVGT